MSDVFKAISDPTRRAILMMVAESPTNINKIKAHFQMSRPAISKHIKILTDNNLIEVKADEIDGRQRNCYAQLEALQEVNQYLTQLEIFWNKKLNGLEKFLDKH
ncbi:UNVERIFIED_CONTAM: hypothetical protein GTU68_067291 [Idotea baltica]|nr:hypothetical protein [Idotea baltica]